MLALLLPGYQIGSPIYESVNSRVYHGRRERDDLPVVLKILKSDRSTPTELARYRREYQIARQLELDGVVRAYALETIQNTVAIVLEDFGGVSLKQYLAQQPEQRLDLSEFLTVALGVVEILGQVHAANVIHKDINPANILYDRESESIKLIDFGISALVTPESPSLKNSTVLEGTLPYMSPEQTGRMNSSLDYRSDFYALGVTFYEMLLGQLPFESSDTMELVHCHIAQTPTPPHELDDRIPVAVSEIVMKLLAKTADERYQSAWGIQADLVLCLMQLEATGTIEDVTPGENDVVNKFRIPQVIYGRDAELRQLHAAFAAIGAVPAQQETAPTETTPTATGDRPSPAALFVVGDPGIGKSALVAESYKPLIRHYGYFISGQFDASALDGDPATLADALPYSALVAAFGELVRQLLAETESSLAQWRDRLLSVLGDPDDPDGSTEALYALIHVIPELQLILDLPPREASRDSDPDRAAIARLFAQFARVFCYSSQPLVLFLDNLQWADSESLNLLEALLTDPQSQRFLAIGAYRDCRVPDEHPVRHLQARLQQRGVPLSQIGLKSLDLDAIAALVADTLQNTPKAVMPLAALIAQKTDGNPFFVREFLKTLDRDRLLVFDDESMSWQWDIDRINAQEIAPNVLSVLLQQLETLPPPTQHLLGLAALMGMEFDLDTIAELSDRSHRSLFPKLVPALVEGLVQPVRGDLPRPVNDGSDPRPDDRSEGVLLRRYRFLHAQVQNAAYRNFAEPFGRPRQDGDAGDNADLASLHLRLGRLLLRRVPQAEQPDRAFELVRHWNLGASAIETDGDRQQRAQLNLDAARASQQRGDYTSAIAYSLSGIEALDLGLWRSQPDLAFALYLERARANFLQGNLDRTRDLLRQLDDRLDDGDPRQVELDVLSVACASLRGEGAVAYALLERSLERFGQSLDTPSDAGDLDLDPDAFATRPRRPSEPVDRLLAQAVVLCATCFPQRLPQVTRALLERSGDRGIAPETAIACAAWSQCQFERGNDDRARRWATLAQELASNGAGSHRSLGARSQALASDGVGSHRSLGARSQALASDGAGSHRSLGARSQAPFDGAGSHRSLGARSQAPCDGAGSHRSLGARSQAPCDGAGSHRCWTYRLLASGVCPWLNSIPTALSLLDEAQRTGSEAGAWFGVGISLADRLLLSFYGGKPLNVLQGDLARALEWCRKYQHQWAIDTLIGLQLTVFDLSRNVSAPGRRHRSPSAQAFLDRCQQPGRELLWRQYHAHLAFGLYLDERYDEAIAAARCATAADATTGDREACGNGNRVLPLALAMAQLTRALCASALQGEVVPSNGEAGEASPAGLDELDASRQQLQEWAARAPETFTVPAAIAEAEWQRLTGDRASAIDSYDRAIDRATRQQLPQFVALTSELAGKFWLERGKPKLAKVYFGEAYVAYQEWGAARKVQQLDTRYGSLLSVAALASSPELSDGDLTPHTNISINYTRSRAAVLDVTTVMKAAQALSGEIVLDRLLDKLMQLAIANAGATRGAIVLSRDDSLMLEIVQTVGGVTARDERAIDPDPNAVTTDPVRREGARIEHCHDLPRSALHYVARTSESVVLNDATAESAFVKDAYIQQFQPKSLLCAPIQGQGKLIGLLYLENNLTAGAFTKDRLDVLMLLCAQAAIALENSRLYTDLKDSEVRERDRAQQLRDSLQELQEAQLQLVQSEKMATLGQLVAGVAHEINNPVGFVDANLSHAAGYVEDLIGLIDLYQETFPEPGEDIEDEIEEIDLEFIVKDLPQILDSMKVGTERIRQISRSLRTFSRADTSAKVAVNLHEGIDSTLMILKPRLKFTKERPAVQVIKDYSDRVSEVSCYAGQLNQVFMNIIANAIDAFDDANVGRRYEDIEANPNCITIQTEWREDEEDADRDWAIVRIRDNGPGMPEEVRQHVFDHLFTTKAVGKGTGLGLSIAYQIVVEKHGGQIACHSQSGQGTEFVIEIPAK